MGDSSVPDAAPDLEYRFDYDGTNFTIKVDGDRLVGCQWVPRGRPAKFVLIFFHGLGAFLSINRPYFPQILQSGGVVLGTDHLGHGRSPGDRGLNSSELLDREIHFLVGRAALLFPEIPLFLYGHSMGGLAALFHVMSGRTATRKLDGVVIECPWIYDKDEVESSWAVRFIGRCGRFILPTLAVYLGGDFDANTKYPAAWIDGYRKCKLAHDWITPRLYASSFEMRDVVRKPDRWPPGMPLLFMQGGRDASVGIEKNLLWAETVRDRNPGMVRIVYQRDGEHAMLRNECGPVVLREMADFITCVLARARIV
jgi:alpha-beta hydrolase superfamily lysophospholipase